MAEGRGDRVPADWLIEHDALLRAQPRGPALDVACGRGRNARHLAAMGFDVLGIDVSDVALAHLESRRGVLPVRTQRADLSEGVLPDGPFEVVVNTFFFERALLGELSRVLAPGGLLLFVTFLKRLEPGELRAAFSDLEILEYREGPPLPGDRPRASLAARKPPRADLVSEVT